MSQNSLVLLRDMPMEMAPEVRREIIQQTDSFVRAKMGHDSSGHDWWHVDRVRKTALELAEAEQADCFVVELAALLHDIADWKFADGDEAAGPAAARAWLLPLDIDGEVIDHVCEIIACLSFKGAHVKTPMRTLEGMVVQDADRLDAIGAVGIARCFAFGGAKNRLIVDPAVAPVLHASFADYKKNNGPSINHFYEKLLLLKDRFNTATGKKLADQRHAFMQQFLTQFFAETRSPQPVIDDGS